MYSNQNKKTNLEKCAQKLAKKVANIPPKSEHKMKVEAYQNFDFKTILQDLENFLNSDLMNFENYEHWLEENVEPNQTR